MGNSFKTQTVESRIHTVAAKSRAKSTFFTSKRTELNDFLSIRKCQDPRILRLSLIQNREEVHWEINYHRISVGVKDRRHPKEQSFIKRCKKRFKKQVGPGYKPQLLVSTKLV